MILRGQPLIRLTLTALFTLLLSCGETDLGNGVSLPSGSGPLTPPFTPGNNLIISETNQADFQSGTLNQVGAVASGALQIGRNYIAETGRLTITNEINQVAATTVNFRNSYTTPIIVGYIPTRANGESLDIRITNKTATGFDIFIDDPDANGIAAAETVVYLVVEQGRHNFASGLSIEAGTHNTASAHVSPGAFGGDVVAFSAPFGGTPVMLHSLNSYNNMAFKSAVCDSATNTQFTIAQETAQTGTATVAEDIGWVAISTGNGTLIDTAFDVGTANNGVNDGVDDAPQAIPLTGFAVAPDIIVKGSSGGGADGYWMRGAGTWSNTNHTSYAEEDQVGDGERNHANETFNYAAFQPDSNVGVFYSTGTRTSAIVDLSGVELVGSSQITFTTTTPAGTTAVVETNLSLDGGATWAGWTTATSGSEISGLTDLVDVSQGQLQYRMTLSTTDETATSSVDDITINVTARTTDN